MPFAYSYVRMSTDIQLRGDSLRRQKEASARYAKTHDLTLIEGFELEDIGVSAFRGKNATEGALSRFLAAVEEGRIPKGSYLLVESLDRISREDPMEATTLFLKILKAGINIVTLADQKLYPAGKAEFTDLIYSIVVMGRAHEESQMKSLRVGAAWDNKRRQTDKKKLTKLAPAWVQLSEDRTSFSLIDEKVAIVRRIFEDASNGYGSYAIARRLNAEQIPSIGGTASWHASYVTKILSNRAVIGEYQPHRKIDGKRIPVGEVVKEYFPSVVSEDRFLAVQAGRRSRDLTGAGRKGPQLRNLFTNLAQCGYCGSPMHFINKGPGPKGGFYLRCSKAHRKAGCASSSWPYGHFEEAFLSFVEELDLNAILQSSTSERNRRALDEELAALQEQLHAVRVKRDRLIDLMADPEFATDLFKEQYRLVDQKRDGLQRNIASVEQSIFALSEGPQLTSEELALLTREFAASDDPEVVERRQRLRQWLHSTVVKLKLFPDGPDNPNDLLPPLNEEASAFVEGLIARGIIRKVEHPSFSVDFKNGKKRFVEVTRGQPQMPRVNNKLENGPEGVRIRSAISGGSGLSTRDASERE
ncbi:recombinase family protein [Rhizobium sp. EC-SD404]|uniref:recombinase family protein n=1 Tax=Rhizobium sp. EC-SD404 TaxID=2038389 RepID=UPI00125728CF|nr:recombinase family protein [Rhizobium sp. EC-SD404]VVS98178.1 Recombinase [Rhizobium sp. EC-SD404]